MSAKKSRFIWSDTELKYVPIVFETPASLVFDECVVDKSHYRPTINDVTTFDQASFRTSRVPYYDSDADISNAEFRNPHLDPVEVDVMLNAKIKDAQAKVATAQADEKAKAALKKQVEQLENLNSEIVEKSDNDSSVE